MKTDFSLESALHDAQFSRNAYSSPSLTLFGSVADMTAGGSGSTNEADANCVPVGQSQNSNFRNCP